MDNRFKSNTTDKDKGVKLVLFLITPVLSLIYSLRSLEKRSSIIYVFLFCILLGLAFTVSDVRTFGSSDGVSYRALFEDYVNVSSADYMAQAAEYFSFSNDIKDFYADTIAFLVSRLTSNYHVFFFVIAVVFAFFQLKSLVFLTRSKNYIGDTVCLLLVFLFTYVSIKNINGLRFWTAYWMACFAILNFFLNKKYRALLLLAALPFVHGSYVVLWIIVVLYLTTNRFEKVWSVLLIVSLFVGNMSLALVQDSASYLPLFLSRYVDSYASSEAVASVGSGASGFYMLDRIFPVIVNIYLFIMLWLVIKERDTITSLRIRNLLVFTIILVSFSNFMMPVPSLGGRFMILSYPFIAYLWLEVIGTTKYKTYIYFMPLVFFMAIYHLIQAYWENVDKFFYISSPIIDLIRFL